MLRVSGILSAPIFSVVLKLKLRNRNIVLSTILVRNWKTPCTYPVIYGCHQGSFDLRLRVGSSRWDWQHHKFKLTSNILTANISNITNIIPSFSVGLEKKQPRIFFINDILFVKLTNLISLSVSLSLLQTARSTMPSGQKRNASKGKASPKKQKLEVELERVKVPKEKTSPQKTKKQSDPEKIPEQKASPKKKKLEVEPESVEVDSKGPQKGKAKKEKVEPIWENAYSTPSTTPSAESSEGKAWNWKFSSWNVNGIRAWLKSGSDNYIDEEKPDVFCVQETKASDEKLPAAARLAGYHCYFSSAEKPGYSGTALFSKREPLSVTYGIGIEEHDNEGRVITAEYANFYVVTAYVPNSGRGLLRHEYRTESWDTAFTEYLQGLDRKKPVIMCGDLNVAHNEIDLRNPGSNKKTAGFTEQERARFSVLLDAGFTDSFRHLHPDTEFAYSFWSYMMGARAKNTGWRLDYFVISDRLKPKLCESLIRNKVLGSDHCPVVLLMAF